jgi:hypothetical protein
MDACERPSAICFFLLVRRAPTFPEAPFFAVEDHRGHADIHQTARIRASVAMLHITALTLAGRCASRERQCGSGPREKTAVAELPYRIADASASMNRDGLKRRPRRRASLPRRVATESWQQDGQ